GILAEDPFEPPQRTGRGLAADAGVDDAERQLGLVDALLDERGPRLVRIEAVSGGERGPDEQDDGRLDGGRAILPGIRGRRVALIGLPGTPEQADDHPSPSPMMS